MSNRPVILVTGKNGQLGNELQLIANNYPSYHFVFTDLAELDIADEAEVSYFFEEHKPSVCINSAAYTAVDKAETDRELAMKVNGEAVGYLASACSKFNTIFIHVSTDYVFNGTASVPYKETDPVDPVNYYGFTKLKGEQSASEKHPASIIVRTSWVYSYFGNNFVKTMLRLMKERESLNVVDDQFGSPTYAADLAESIMSIATADQQPGGIYQFSNEGMISWWEFAVAIRDYAQLKCKINPIDTAGYPTPAKRPHYSVFDKSKLISTFDIHLKGWKGSLHKCLDLLLRG